MAITHDGEERPITGINVTPLVDVTLVLLIVFLVTAEMIGSQAIPLDVPSVARPGAVHTILAVSIDAHGAIAIDGALVGDDAEVVRVAQEAHSRDPQVRAVIRAAPTTAHGVVVRVVDDFRRADVTKIAVAVDKTSAP